MDSQSVLFIFIGLTIFNFLFTTVLEYINDKNWKESIPNDLEGFYDSDKYQKAKNYKIERGKISLLNSSISFVITLLILFFFGFGLISEYAVSLSNSIIVQSCIFFMIFHLLTTFLGIPFSYYSTFFIEEKYGFNKTTLKTFIVDKINMIISVFLTGPYKLIIINEVSVVVNVNICFTVLSINISYFNFTYWILFVANISS